MTKTIRQLLEELLQLPEEIKDLPAKMYDGAALHQRDPSYSPDEVYLFPRGLPQNLQTPATQ